MLADEFRVEVDLGADHGLTLAERLHAHDLDDEARERLGGQVVVTRDGDHLFLYAASRESADEARRAARELVEADGLEAAITLTRWHPVEAAWKDADTPLPESEEARRSELRARAEREAAEGGGTVSPPGFVLLGSYKPGFLRDLGL